MMQLHAIKQHLSTLAPSAAQLYAAHYLQISLIFTLQLITINMVPWA